MVPCPSPIIDAARTHGAVTPDGRRSLGTALARQPRRRPHGAVPSICLPFPSIPLPSIARHGPCSSTPPTPSWRGAFYLPSICLLLPSIARHGPCPSTPATSRTEAARGRPHRLPAGWTGARPSRSCRLQRGRGGGCEAPLRPRSASARPDPLLRLGDYAISGRGSRQARIEAHRARSATGTARSGAGRRP